MPTIQFTDFYPLWSLGSVIATKRFNPLWNQAYETIRKGKGSYTYPHQGGCGQKIGSFQLMPRERLPSPIALLDNGQNGIIYVMCSTVYPILYVGITDSRLRTGIFGGGRFSHHMRKLFACHSSSTSHTAGWQTHAVTRYRDRIRIHGDRNDANPNTHATKVGGDLVMAFGTTNEPWRPGDHEGTVLDAIFKALDFGGLAIEVLNTATISRSEAVVITPANLQQTSGALRSFNALSDEDRLARLNQLELVQENPAAQHFGA